jgi:hypothetical protein
MELPNEVYVFVEKEGEDYEFLCVEDEIAGCATKDGKRLVGVYELKKKINVSLEVKEDVIVESAA